MSDRFTVSVPEYLRSQGHALEIVGRDADGSPIARDASGQENKIDMAGLRAEIEGQLKAQGIDPKAADFEVNDAKSPIQESPVDTKTRLKMAFGDTRGNLAFLKKQFEAVQYDADQGFLVKKEGFWHAVDPDLLGKGDAWDKTKKILSLGLAGNKDLAGDLADLVPTAISGVTQAVGAAFGTAAAGPAGSVGGAAAGGAVGGVINTSLGRMIGTYQATEAEQMQDVALEMALGAGGQAVSLAAKPTLGMLIKAGQKVGKTASNGTKAVLSGALGRMTNSGPEAFDYLWEQPARLGASITKWAKGTDSWKTAVNKVAQEKVKILDNLLNEAEEALPRKYGQLLDEVVEASQGRVKVNMREVYDEVLQGLQSAGFGTVKEVKDTSKQFAQIMKKEPTLKNLRFLNLRKFAQQSVEGQEAELFVGSEKAEFKRVLSVLNRFASTGNFQGKEAAVALRGVEKSLNKITRKAADSTSPDFQRLVGIFRTQYRNAVSSQFDKAGLNTEYSALSGLYKKFGDDVASARKILGSEKGLEVLSNQIVSAPGRNPVAKELRDSLVTLTGEAGRELVDRFSLLHATEKFLPMSPQLGVFQVVSGSSILSTMFAAQAASTGTVIPAAAGIAAAATPRVVARGMQGALFVTRGPGRVMNETAKFLAARTPEELKTLLSNEHLVKGLLRTAVEAPFQEQTQRDELLKRTGVR